MIFRKAARGFYCKKIRIFFIRIEFGTEEIKKRPLGGSVFMPTINFAHRCILIFSRSTLLHYSQAG